MLWAVILIGIFLRFLPGLQADFPLNDGGMFLSMIRDLRANHFLIPQTTSYNFSNIPFAYPPFGIYVAAFLSWAFPISEIAILRWLPALVSAAVVPVFYWLALQISDSKTKTFIAAAIYAFLPNTFDWLVMGGGLTRSFGILFSLLAFGHVYRLFHDGQKDALWWSVLFCALAVLSHPEVGLQTAVICVLIWFFFGRNLADIRDAVLVALGTALLTSPWWLTILIQHGFSPFESAVQTGVRETLLASIFYSFFSLQGGLPILPVLSLLGIFVTFRKREFFLTAWAFLPFFADPRNAPAVAVFPLVLLSSEGLYFLREEFGRAYSNTIKGTSSKPVYMTTASFSVLLIYLLVISFRSAISFSRVSLRATDRETMTWVEANIPVNSRFLLLTNTGQISPMADAYQEWFPVLAERKSQNTLQGSEWTLGSEFYPYSQELMALQGCMTTTCLHDWMKDNNVQTEYILVRTKRVSPDLLISLESDSRYKPVYESADTIIFGIIS